MAAYVMTLAGGCLTRETEHYLLWELPLRRGWLYYHAALCQAGAETVPATGHNLHTKLAQLRRRVAMRRK